MRQSSLPFLLADLVTDSAEVDRDIVMVGNVCWV